LRPRVSARELAVALPWAGPPEYPRLRALAEGVVRGLASRIRAGQPLYLVLDADIVRTLGHILRDELDDPRRRAVA